MNLSIITPAPPAFTGFNLSDSGATDAQTVTAHSVNPNTVESERTTPPIAINSCPRVTSILIDTQAAAMLSGDRTSIEIGVGRYGLNHTTNDIGGTTPGGHQYNASYFGQRGPT